MNKIELRILSISRSVSQETNYALVLGEVGGRRRLPVIIGGEEAKAIALAIEGITSKRPLTHDLVKNTLETLGVSLSEIIINDIKEGTFYARIILDNHGKIAVVDSRPSDAIALATRFDCPIYTYENVMEESGIEFEIIEENDDYEEAVEANDESVNASDSLSRKSVKELNDLLAQVLADENYERAALIRDELEHRKQR